MPEFTKYDSDPEALAWARARVQHTIDKMRRFERQAREQGTTDPEQWRKFGNMLEREFIGGQGCVIASFDERTPHFVKALAASGPPASDASSVPPADPPTATTDHFPLTSTDHKESP